MHAKKSEEDFHHKGHEGTRRDNGDNSAFNRENKAFDKLNERAAAAQASVIAKAL